MYLLRFATVLILMGLTGTSCVYVQIASETVVDAIDTELTVGHEYIRDEYIEKDTQSSIKRIGLAMEPLVIPGLSLDRKLQTLWMDMVYDYIGHHKDYIILRYSYPESSGQFALRKVCEEDKRLEGVLHTQLTRVAMEDEEVDLRAYVSLYDCERNTRVWGAMASSDYDMDDDELAQMIRSEVAKLGPVTAGYTGGFYHLSRKALRSLPAAKLEDLDFIDKIEADAVGPDGR